VALGADSGDLVAEVEEALADLEEGVLAVAELEEDGKNFISGSHI